MARYDVVVIGAGLGGLTAGAILARAGRKVLVIERSNSVGGAASSYKSGDLFVEGSLHETSDPNDPRDPKHGALLRAGVLDAVKWIPGGGFYQARGGPLREPFAMPDNFDAARRALTDRFPQSRGGIDNVLDEMERLATAKDFNVIAESDRSLSLSQKFEQRFRQRRSRQMRAGRKPVLLSRRSRHAVVAVLRDVAGRVFPQRRALCAGRLAAALQRARPRRQDRRRRGGDPPRRHRHRLECAGPAQRRDA